MLNVMVVGQTPPPLHGQAMMIQGLVGARLAKVKLFHVRLAFSRDIADVGQLRPAKLLHLFGVILRIAYMRVRYHVPILYYPPAGGTRVAMYRDLAILIATRWMFRSTVFHFHASGVSELYPQLGPIARCLYRIAYFEPDVAIVPSRRNAPDAGLLLPKKEIVVPYGIDDEYRRFAGLRKPSTPEILFVGALRESKGVLVLLEAARILRQRGVQFSLRLVGEFASRGFEELVSKTIQTSGLGEHVALAGPLSGDAKWKAFARASVFCFPTFFELEALPVVVLEAMQFALPVIATDWRGVADLVRDGESGYLVPVRDAAALADKVDYLLRNPGSVKRMGEQGRRRYLQEYTLERFLERMQSAFLTLDGPAWNGPFLR